MNIIKLKWGLCPLCFSLVSTLEMYDNLFNFWRTSSRPTKLMMLQFSNLSSGFFLSYKFFDIGHIKVCHSCFIQILPQNFGKCTNCNLYYNSCPCISANQNYFILFPKIFSTQQEKNEHENILL